MSEAAVEEISVLSSIYCGEGEFQLLQQSDQNGLMVRINTSVAGGKGTDLGLLFHLHPLYPSHPPDISVSSTRLSRTQCQNIRKELIDQASALTPEPMVHQLVQWVQQSAVVQEEWSGGEESVNEREEEEEEDHWTAVLALDHIRNQNRYIGLLERWTQQLQLTGRLLLGRCILVIVHGARANIKDFCRLLKTVKVDVDSTGKKCKERMMKVLIETPSSSSHGHGLQGFLVKSYQSLPELSAAFQDFNMIDIYQQIKSSLSD